MRDHLADCYQARGLSSAGSEQVANQQTPASPVDQAMMGAQEKVLPPLCYENNEYGYPRETPCVDSKPDQAANNGKFWGEENSSTSSGGSSGGNVWGGDSSTTNAVNKANVW